MGVKRTADVRITFKLKDGQPEHLAQTALTRKARRLKDAIEQGGGMFILETGVQLGSADIEILSQGPIG